MQQDKGLIFNIQKFSIHDGPGIRTTVFMKGCPLRCKWCSNPESQSIHPQMLDGKQDSRWYTVDEVVAECLKDIDFYEESNGGVTISGGEPLVQAPFVLQLLKALKAQGIHTAVESTGHVTAEVLLEALPYIDLVLFDVKHYDSAAHKKGTAVGNQQILDNLRRIVEAGAGLLPRIPVIPGFNSKPADAHNFALLLRGLGISRAQLLPFHQLGERKYELLGLPYELKEQKALYEEDLASYKQAFINEGVNAFF